MGWHRLPGCLLLSQIRSYDPGLLFHLLVGEPPLPSKLEGVGYFFKFSGQADAVCIAKQGAQSCVLRSPLQRLALYCAAARTATKRIRESPTRTRTPTRTAPAKDAENAERKDQQTAACWAN
jgi:hypothetical protein